MERIIYYMFFIFASVILGLCIWIIAEQFKKKQDE
jgi:hypothetical protein